MSPATVWRRRFLRLVLAAACALFGFWLGGEALSGFAAAPVRPFDASPPRTGAARAAFEAWRMRTPDGGPIDPVWTERALARMEEMAQRDSTRGPEELAPRRELGLETDALVARARRGASEAEVTAWTPLGPGNIGGRTRALVIHPSAPNVVYAAGVSGGVWKSANYGQTWLPTGSMGNLAVVSLAIDPRFPDTLYAGTGESFHPFRGLRGAGIFRSEDGGDHWVRLPGTPASDTNFHYVSDLLVSPNSPQVLYAATSTGVWRSRNGGQSFSRFLASGTGAGCQDLALRSAGRADVLFAACGIAEPAAVWRHTFANGFSLVGWSKVLEDPDMQRTALAIAPSNPDVIYAVSATLRAQPDYNGFHAVFRSTAGGAAGTWSARVRGATTSQRVTATLLSEPFKALADLCDPDDGVSQYRSQGSFDLAIAVDPTDSNRVWVGGIDLFRSDNGGAGFGRASYWVSSHGNYAHADQHVLLFHPLYDGLANRILYAGNDGGVFATLTSDRRVATTTEGVCKPSSVAASEVFWFPLNDNYQVTQFYYGGVYPADSRVLGGTQDNGTVRNRHASADPIDTWSELWGGDGGTVAVHLADDAGDPPVVYVASQDGNVRKSTDGGETFAAAFGGLTSRTGVPNDEFAFPTYFVLDRRFSQRLWAAGTHLWRTNNAGGVWLKVSDPLPGNDVFKAIAVDPRDSRHVVAGSLDGRIWRSFDATADAPVWRESRIPSCRVSDLEFDPANSRFVWATCSNFGVRHVWRSRDRGRSWVPADGVDPLQRIPDLPVLALALDTVPGRVFAATDLGVVSSVDGGVSWAIERTGFPNTRAADLVLRESEDGGRALFVFTHGRGAFKGDLR